MSTLQKVRGDGSRGPGPPPLDFAFIEKRTEAEIEIDNLSIVAPQIFEASTASAT